MKAIVINEPGPPEVLRLEARAAPSPADSEVRIRVAAAGVNRADVMQRQGKYPAPAGVPADIPGLEVAGWVESCGAAVQRWKPGDAVCALLAGGGYAEQVVVEAAHCLPVPAGMPVHEAAALPETVFTVWDNVFRRGALKAGERFLAHGGSSGIGQTAIQLAHAMGAAVSATAGTEAKCAACLRAGAERAVNYREVDFGEVLREPGFDVILDMVGGEYVAKNLRLLRPEGRLVQIAIMGGRRSEVDLLAIMNRRLTLTGSTLRSRESSFKATLAADVEAHVWPLIAEGRFHPVIDRVFLPDEAAEAHRRMEAGAHVGKILIRFSE